MKSDILIFGRGYIGNRLGEALGATVTARRIKTLKDVQREIDRVRPRCIVNAIGYTGGRNVDGCEEEPDRTLSANTFVPLILTEAALRNKVKMVHISSGCIYHYDYTRQKPIDEDRIPDFFGLYYSRTKIYAERALDVLSKEYGVLTLRIRIPLDNRPNPRNILTKLLNFKKVITLRNSVTYLPDFVEAAKHLIARDACGIYNVVNSGGLSYPELLETYKKYVPDFSYKIIGYKKLGLVRTNLIMSTKKLEKTGFRVRPIKGVLNECVKEYLEY